MRKAKNPKVGDVIQFPYKCFDNRRSGWNGWIFRAGIIEKLGTNKAGQQFATVRYCKSTGRHALRPYLEEKKNIKAEYLFAYDVEWNMNRAREALDVEMSGQPICWDNNLALLIMNV